MCWYSPRPHGPRFERRLRRPRDYPGLARLRAIADHPRTARPQGYDLEPRPHHRCAVLHRTQTESARISAGVLQALTIVANLQSDVLPIDVEAHIDGLRVRMFERVCERLLSDPVEVIGGRGAQPEPRDFADGDIHRGSRWAFQARDEIAQRTDQSALIRPDGRQSARNGST